MGPVRALRRLVLRLRTDPRCGNCRYYEYGFVHGYCCQHAWDGGDIAVSADQPGCERWRRNRASDFEE